MTLRGPESLGTSEVYGGRSALCLRISETFILHLKKKSVRLNQVDFSARLLGRMKILFLSKSTSVSSNFLQHA